MSGILLGLSYPNFDPIPTGILAWFAFVPFLLSIRQTTSFGQWVINSVLMLVLAHLLNIWWVAKYSFAALAICFVTQIPFMVLPFLAFYFISKKTNFAQSLLLFPFVYTLADWFLHTLPHGLQVYLLPYTQANNTWLIQFIDVFGMFGVSFWVMMMNVLILRFLEKKTASVRAIIMVWLGIPLIYSLFCTKLNRKSVIGASNRTTKVSIIQTNLDSYSTDSTIVQKTFDEIVSLSDSAVKTAKPDLMVMPEGAIPIPLFQNKSLLDFAKNAIANWQTSVAIGYVEYPDSAKRHVFRNNALVFTPELAIFWDSLRINPQDLKVYQKRYGLPFVELMPYLESTPTARGSAMERGTEPYTFDYANLSGDKFRVALTICWEQMYPHRIAELANQGAEFVALMNNDAWFGTSGGGKQLMSYTRLRAIENRRSIVRCSNGGISCFIDPFGNISGRLPWYKATIGTQDVLCVSKKTFFSKHPAWFPKFCGAILILSIILFWGFRAKNTIS